MPSVCALDLFSSLRNLFVCRWKVKSFNTQCARKSARQRVTGQDTNSKHKIASGDNHQAEQSGNDKEISNALFVSLVNQSSKDLSEDFCLPLDIRLNFASFEFLMPEEEEYIRDEK